MFRTTCHTLAIATLSLIYCQAVQAENWPQWRGPYGDGSTTETGLPTSWSADKNVAWKVDLPEEGNSTPVIWGDKVFLTQPEAETQTRQLRCYSRLDGSELWMKAIVHDQQESTHGQNPYASSSPVTDGERVIVWFGSAGLHCFDLQGEPIWSRELGKQEHMWGYGSSPLIHGNLCILNFGPGNREQLIAVDKATGQTVWKVDPLTAEEELALSGHDNDGNANRPEPGDQRREMIRGSWSTPILTRFEGQDLLIVNHPRRVTAYDPENGRLVWTCGQYAPLAYMSPVRANDLVIALGGYNGASVGIRLGGSGNVTESHLVWQKARDNSWLGTGIVEKGFLYVCNMGGVLHCFDVNSGELSWRKRLPAESGSAASWSSMIIDGDRNIYLATKSGHTFVFRPNPTGYQQVAYNTIDEPTNSTIAASQGQLFLRTSKALRCIGDSD